MYRTLFYVFLFNNVLQNILFKMLNIRTDHFWFASSHFHIAMLSNGFTPATRCRGSDSTLLPSAIWRSHCERSCCKMVETFLWMYSWEMTRLTLRIWSVQSYSRRKVKKSRTIKLWWESQKTTAACRQKVQSGPAGVVSAVPCVASTPRTSTTLLQSRNPADRQTDSAVSLLCHCWFVLTWQADVEKHRGQQSARSLYLPLVNRRTPLSATHIHPRVYSEDDQSAHMLHFQRQSELQVKTPAAPLHVSWCWEPLHREYNTILMNNVFLNTDFSFPHTRGFF